MTTDGSREVQSTVISKRLLRSAEVGARTSLGEGCSSAGAQRLDT